MKARSNKFKWLYVTFVLFKSFIIISQNLMIILCLSKFQSAS